MFAPDESLLIFGLLVGGCPEISLGRRRALDNVKHGFALEADLRLFKCVLARLYRARYNTARATKALLAFGCTCKFHETVCGCSQRWESLTFLLYKNFAAHLIRVRGYFSVAHCEVGIIVSAGRIAAAAAASSSA